MFATRGNFATMFATFEVMLLSLYGVLTVISLTILVPVYYYGTDVSWSTNYLTFWSKITIPHLELGSAMNIIPIMIIILVSYLTMFFYKQFTIVYVFFRQRCLKRAIPQNYVVLLQNIPDVLNYKDEIANVLSPI